MILETLTLVSLGAWIYLALFHGAFWKPLLDEDAPPPPVWPSVDVIVPARNEASILPKTLPSLLAQAYPGTWRVILVNDHSEDETVATAKVLAQRAETVDRLVVINAPALEKGWRGKLAAMQAGLAHSEATFVLFTDADIWHPTFSLKLLAARAIAQNLDFVSLMVKLRTLSWTEKLMIPAFVFFFAMLYPFRRANDPRSKVAAAAGGTMFIKRAALDAAGGLGKIKDALIDDCALARLLKDSGATVKITLTRDVLSLRAYPHMRDIHDMIARTAFYQLRHSFFLLTCTFFGLCLLFVVPVIAEHLLAASAALTIMTLLYWPIVRFYGLSGLWSAALPFAAIFYIVATIDSAWRHAQGRGGLWKGRTDNL